VICTPVLPVGLESLCLRHSGLRHPRHLAERGEGAQKGTCWQHSSSLCFLASSGTVCQCVPLFTQLEGLGLVAEAPSGLLYMDGWFGGGEATEVLCHACRLCWDQEATTIYSGCHQELGHIRVEGRGALWYFGLGWALSWVVGWHACGSGLLAHRCFYFYV
jgi:hypothetical protein